MRLCTFHEKSVPSNQTLLSINAWPALGDRVVEGVEYGDNILGVQGHPEVDDLLPELFQFLAE
jgi:gamma-glutamyl-gamma-aminobutyrate hydrolase PuuD